MDIWGHGHPEMGAPTTPPKKVSKSKSVSPKMSTRSGSAEYKFSWPQLGPFQDIFSRAEKIQNMHNICLFSLVRQWALFTRFGPLLLSTRGGEIGTFKPSNCSLDLFCHHQANLHFQHWHGACRGAASTLEKHYLFPHLGSTAARVHQGK